MLKNLYKIALLEGSTNIDSHVLASMFENGLYGYPSDTHTDYFYLLNETHNELH